MFVFALVLVLLVLICLVIGFGLGFVVVVGGVVFRKLIMVSGWRLELKVIVLVVEVARCVRSCAGGDGVNIHYGVVVVLGLDDERQGGSGGGFGFEVMLKSVGIVAWG